MEESSRNRSTPLLLAEAVGPQSFHRRNKNPRIVLPRLKTQSSHHLCQGESYDIPSDTDSFEDSTQDLSKRSESLIEYHASGMLASRSGSLAQDGPHVYERDSIDDHHVGGSATPPDTENEFDRSQGFKATREGCRRPPALSALSTSPLQGASLPSPSLSPITAAANLHAANLNRSVTSGELLNENDATRQPSAVTSTLQPQHRAFQWPQLELPSFKESNFGNVPIATPSFTDIPRMIDSFDAMPDAMKTYVMYQLLRRSPKITLQFVADVVNPALRCDFLGRLPLELSLHMLRYLDAKSLCRAAQVSKKWRHLIDSDEKAWKDLLDVDGFQLPEGEIERAVREGWGWQCPSGPDDWEKDVSRNAGLNRAKQSTLVRSSTTGQTSGDVTSDSMHREPSPKRKRRTSLKPSSHKRQKRKWSSTAQVQSGSWIHSSERAQGPNAFANAAAAAVPDPYIGLRTLKGLHLFKSIYQRHHLIRKSWMHSETEPLHLAFRAHERHVVTCLQFDSERILTGSDDANIDIYDTQSGASLKRLEGHEGGVWALEYQGNILVSGSTDRSVRIWNIAEGRCLQVFQGHTSTVRCLQILQPVQVGEKVDGTPIMMPKSPLIITGSRDSSCRVWRLPKPEDRSIFQTGPAANDNENPYFVRTLTGHHHSVRAIAAYADTLVSGSYDATVRVWKISTGECVHRLQGHTTKVYSVVLDYARGRCISGSMDNLVKVWSLETGSCLFNLEGHTSLVGLLDLKDDCLVSAAADSTLRIWDPENGRCKHTLQAHTGAITCFAHDGQKIISGSDRTLKMWNTKTGECIRDLLNDLSGVWQVKFDDRRCVAAVHRNNWTYIEVMKSQINVVTLLTEFTGT